MGISDKCVLVMVCVAFVGAGALYLYVARNLGAALRALCDKGSASL